MWVTAVNGTTADGWVYEVNGARPMVGADAYALPPPRPRLALGVSEP